MGHEDSVLTDRPVGVIIPPQEIKKVIDRTAEFVAKNGSSFEQMLKKKQQNLPKLSFLNEGDPYRPYYEQMISSIVKGLTEDPNIKEKQIQISHAQVEEKKKNQEDIKRFIEEKKMEKEMELKPPANDQYTINHPSINPLELDILKLTAQFVARNGQRLLNGLSERESKNSQFDFLKPNHHLFGYFTNLVDSYSKCLLPRKDEIQKLQSYSNDRFAILKKASERHFWEKRQRENQKKKDDIDELEKAQSAAIDWYDFAIVENVDFNDIDMQQHYPQNNMVNMEDMNSDINQINIQQNNLKEHVKKVPEEKDDIQMNIPKRTDDVILNENLPEPNMKIVKNFTRRPEAGKTEQQVQKCPKCGENIPLNEWSEHLKIEMIDPKWREKKLELMETNQSTIITEDNEMKKHLTKLTQRRPDLFGDVNDEIVLEEHKKSDNKTQIKWDGYAPNMSRTTANIAMLAQQQKKNFEDLKKTQDPINTINPLKSQATPTVTVASNLPNVNNIAISPNILVPSVSVSQPSVNNKVPSNIQQSNVIEINQPSLNKPVQTNIISQPPNLNIKNNPVNIPQTLINNSILRPQSMIPSQMNNQSMIRPQQMMMMPPGMINPGMIGMNMSFPFGMMEKKEIDLMPEKIWIQNNPNPIFLNIKVPDAGGDESWGFRGQLISLKDIDPKLKISEVKELLSKYLGNMPYKRMKLRTFTHIEFKNDFTVGYYNMPNNLMMELIVKERGGKKN